MNHTRREAMRLGHDVLDSEHILLALLLEPDSYGMQVLAVMNVSFESIRAEVERAVEVGGHRDPLRSMPFTVGAKKVLEQSMNEAFELGNRHIGTEHLLLGLFHPEVGPVPHAVFGRLDLDVDDARAIVLRNQDIDEDAGPVRLHGG